MTEQPHSNLSVVNTDVNHSFSSEVLLNGNSGKPSKVYVPEDEVVINNNENVDASKLYKADIEGLDRSFSNSNTSDIKDDEKIMREKMSDTTNGQVNYSETEADKLELGKASMEKYDSEGTCSSTENLEPEDTHDTRDRIVVHKIREIDYLTDRLDNNFESSMDRKSSAESGFEEQTNLSNTGSLEKKTKLVKDESSVSDLSGFESDGAKDIMTQSYSSAVSSTGSPVSSPADFFSDMSMSTLLQQEVEPLIDEDSSTSVSCSFGNSLSDSTCSSGNQTPDIILERSMSDSGMSPVHFEEVSRSLPTSKSIEKVSSINRSSKEPNVVRASKSHENYLHNQDFQFIAIDIDDVAYSLDQIPQNPTPTLHESFEDKFGAISQESSNQDLLGKTDDETDSKELIKDEISQSVKNETQSDDISADLEKRLAHSVEESIETKAYDNESKFNQANVSEKLEEFSETEQTEPKPCDITLEESNIDTPNFDKCYTEKDDSAICDNLDQCAMVESSDTKLNDNIGLSVNSIEKIIKEKEPHETYEIKPSELSEEQNKNESYDTDKSETSALSDEIVETCDDYLTKEFGPDGLFYQPPAKQIDQPSAQRLAKRLYNLDGFQKSDVARHLSKK